MKRSRWQLVFGLFLVVLSIVLYGFHYVIFRDTRHIFLWSFTSLAFLPISILFVTLIINGLLSTREKRALLQKLNMIIGVFFSEVGTLLLTYLSDFDPKLGAIKKDLVVSSEWSDREFSSIDGSLKNYDFAVEIDKVDLKDLRSFLVEKRRFLTHLLENPNLLEHESFTNLLQAIFHLAQELTFRDDVKELPDTDCQHLAGDINRVYGLLVYQWLDYMKYLKDNYPYLFSLSMRTNPFDEKASPIVK